VTSAWPPVLQVDPSLAFNNPVPATEPGPNTPQQPAAALAPLAELPAQAPLAPAPETAATAAASPAPAPAKAGSAAGGGGGNNTVPSFRKGGQEYFITIGADGNFQNGCQTFFPTGWNQCAALQLLPCLGLHAPRESLVRWSAACTPLMWCSNRCE
jgi:hypothetical protein